MGEAYIIFQACLKKKNDWNNTDIILPKLALHWLDY